MQTIEAERIDPAEGDVSLWSTEPRPLLGELPRKELYREQGLRSGINAVIGAWPGEQSEEDVRALLEDLS